MKEVPGSRNKLEGKDLYEAIYSIVRKIPRGRISTYGAIAESIGMKSGARLVGYAMNHAHGQKPAVPAHRVVNRVGLLTGKHHFSKEGEMQRRLEAEGIKVTDDKVRDFEKHFWDPAIELGY